VARRWCSKLEFKFGLHNEGHGRPSATSIVRHLSIILHDGLGSSVSIATDYGLDGPVFEFRWERDFPPIQTGPGAHPASCKMGTGSLPGVKCGRGVLLTTHPLLAPRSWKSRVLFPSVLNIIHVFDLESVCLFPNIYIMSYS
jgi:hypothetical protein